MHSHDQRVDLPKRGKCWTESKHMLGPRAKARLKALMKASGCWRCWAGSSLGFGNLRKSKLHWLGLVFVLVLFSIVLFSHVFCYAVLCYTMLYYTMLCYALLHAMLCYAKAPLCILIYRMTVSIFFVMYTVYCILQTLVLNEY